MKAGELPIYKKFPDDNTEYVLTPRENSYLRNYLLSAITPTRRSIQEWYTTAEKFVTTLEKIRLYLLEEALSPSVDLEVSSWAAKAFGSHKRIQGQVGRFPYGHSPSLAHQGLIVLD
ncbi:hypothetical protein SprV_0301179100 [Sparganum proliferum]